MYRSRRWYLVTLGTAGLTVLSGCLGGNVVEREVLEPNRDSREAECETDTLIDESFHLQPRWSPVGTTGQEWPIELVAGDVIRLSIFWWGERGRVMPLPDLRVTDPEENTILDESGYSTNHHEVAIERTGTHTLDVQNRDRSEGGEWKLELFWYSDAQCM